MPISDTEPPKRLLIAAVDVGDLVQSQTRLASAEHAGDRVNVRRIQMGSRQLLDDVMELVHETTALPKFRMPLSRDGANDDSGERRRQDIPRQAQIGGQTIGEFGEGRHDIPEHHVTRLGLRSGDRSRLHPGRVNDERSCTPRRVLTRCHPSASNPARL